MLCVGLQRRFFKMKKVSLPFFPAAWNVDVRTCAPAAILDHEVTWRMVGRAGRRNVDFWWYCGPTIMARLVTFGFPLWDQERRLSWFSCYSVGSCNIQPKEHHGGSGAVKHLKIGKKEEPRWPFSPLAERHIGDKVCNLLHGCMRSEIGFMCF